MEMSIKEKVLIGVIASTIVLAVGGSVWALVTPNNDKVKNNDETSLEESSPASSLEEEKLNEEPTVSKSNEDTSTASQPNTDTTSEPTPSYSETNPEPSNIQTQKQPATAPSSSPRTTQGQPEKVSCNESMKASYTSLYNSQISAENARWANQVNGFNNQATGSGGSFSGGAQDKINQYKPAHDARIASINNDYQSNLASINCN